MLIIFLNGRNICEVINKHGIEIIYTQCVTSQRQKLNAAFNTVMYFHLDQFCRVISLYNDLRLITICYFKHIEWNFLIKKWSLCLDWRVKALLMFQKVSNLRSLDLIFSNKPGRSKKIVQNWLLNFLMCFFLRRPLHQDVHLIWIGRNQTCFSADLHHCHFSKARRIQDMHTYLVKPFL